MSPASYLTAPPRVARRSIAPNCWGLTPLGVRPRVGLARSEAGRGERQPVRGVDRGERALGADPPAEHATGVRMQRIEELPVRAERLVADTRPALDGGRRDGLAELDAAVVADRVGRDRAVTEVRHEGDAPVVAHDRPADLAARVAD